MEFALTRKQLNKKRQGQEGPPAPAPAGFGSAPGAGVDPVTGLPIGYDPSTQPVPVVAPPAAPAAAAPSGGDFFTSGTGILGGQAPPAAPTPFIPETFGQMEAPPAPPAPGVAPPVAPPPAVSAPRAMDPSVPSPPAWAPYPFDPSNPVHLDPSSGSSALRGHRRNATAVIASAAKRYIGFLIFLLLALLIVEFLPSLRHSDSTPSGLGPVPSAAPGGSAGSGLGSAPAAGSVSSGAGVTSVSVSY